MLECCRHLWSDFQEWKEEISEQVSEKFGHHWKYYTKERAVLKGLPIAIISATAAAYLFNCAKLSTGAIFGAVNYIILTSLLEIIRAHHKIDKTKASVILGISGAISLAFIQTVCKTSMTYQAAFVLGIAAFAGQLAREFLATEDYE